MADIDSLKALLQQMNDQMAVRMQEQMTAQLQVLQATIAQQNDKIATLTQRLSSVETTSGAPPRVTLTPPETDGQYAVDAPTVSTPGFDSATSPTTQTARLSEKLPDPPLFKGSRKELPSFLNQLQYKLEANSDRYPTPRSRFLYSVSLLRGDAGDLVRPLLDKGINTAEQVISFLESTYGDPNRKATAQNRLADLKQGKRSFLTHFAEFRRLAVDADLNEPAQVLQLKASLNPELRKSMIGARVPDSITDYANLIAAYDADLRAINHSAQPRRQQHHQHRHSTASDPNAMDIDTMDYAPVGSSERERRKRKGLCFKCGSDKHISPDCKVPIPRGSSSPNRSRNVYAVESKNRSPARSRQSSGSSSRSSSSSRPRSRRSKERSRN